MEVAGNVCLVWVLVGKEKKKEPEGEILSAFHLGSLMGSCSFYSHFCITSANKHHAYSHTLEGGGRIDSLVFTVCGILEARVVVGLREVL